jgi:DNA-binding NtrC family response regulator
MEQPGNLVYVVDDRTVIAETLATILNQAGFRALAFDDPTIALSAASIKHPDALISDVIMPRMTGIDLAIRVRSAHPQCRVVLYSGQIHTADLLERAKNEGHEFEVLAKPVHPDQILERLRDLPNANLLSADGQSSGA